MSEPFKLVRLVVTRCSCCHDKARGRPLLVWSWPGVMADRVPVCEECLKDWGRVVRRTLDAGWDKWRAEEAAGRAL